MKITFRLIPLLLMAATATAADTKPPNIVLLLSDDQGYTDYGFMGHDEIETPNLDKLARESALFRRGYVPTALCRPALMTLITGLYSHQNLTTGNDPAGTITNKDYAERAGEDARELLISHIDRTGALPQWLATKGYVSHQSGKWWEGSFQRGGFTEGMTKGFPNRGGRHGDAGLKIGREGLEPVTEFIDRSVAAEKPFFVWYAPFMPHTPHTPPDRLFKKYVEKGVQERIAKYYAMCEWFDETCGALLDHIDNSGIADNTLVVYVTDNGWIQTEAGSYAPRSKRSPNEFGTRTPIMFRWPGKIRPADRPELCSSIDFVPTVMAAAGAAGPHEFPGLNLLPELKSGEAIERDTLFGETFAHDIADIENPQASLLYRWVIRANDKLLITYDGAAGKMKYPPKSGASQLFDLLDDPDENRNLAEENPELVKQLSNLLDDWYVADQRQAGRVAPAASESDRKPKRHRVSSSTP
ncbi:MAG: sulfatase family protein [Rubripirellula sp.]